MAGYSPLKITGFQTGLVQEREEFLLPDDAYPRLRNAYVWRERLKRKKGCLLLGRLQRNLTAISLGNTGASPWSFNIFADAVPPIGAAESNKELVPGTVVITIAGPIVFTDQGNGTLTSGTAGNSGTVNYATGDVILTHTAGAAVGVTAVFSYFPGLPVMGIRVREVQNTLEDETVFFDQVYAYRFNGTTNRFEEFIAGTTWNAHAGTVSAVDFFWSTNWWVSQSPLFTTDNRKLFWVTNNTGSFGASQDPPRITDGVTWVDFIDGATPTNTPWAQIGNDATPTPVYLTNFLAILPFRGRLVTFNTFEGTDAANSVNYSNRIRWSTIGNPFIPYAAGPPATGSWRDDIRGQGGFLDIPTSDDIISVGFVRDNLVIYCENSTWQLRYTGRAIAPFQVERVNSELGCESTFSAVQFDTSLMGVGDKGIVECDSYKSERIDIKILDFVFEISRINNGPKRVHGVRDFINRLAFWTIPLDAEYDARVPQANQIFPNIRLLYNYENDSWAIFEDSFTTIGTFQVQSSRTWLTQPTLSWVQCNFSWIGSRQTGQPFIVAGNQQGYVEYIDRQTTNDVSLSITGIQPNTTQATVITSPNHNLKSGDVIGISGIPSGTPYDNLNGGIYGINLGDNLEADPTNKFRLMLYNSTNNQFSTPQTDVPDGDYVGGGGINIRENFSIVSKKFNFLDEGQSIQMGYLDVLMSSTESSNPGAISLNVYLDYNDNDVSNTLPLNRIANASPYGTPDTFFNSTIPTTASNLNGVGGTKFWQRVYCATRANFLTLEFTFSNAQMAAQEQELDVQIDASILWLRRAGRLSQI